MKTKRTGNWIFSTRSAVAALAAFCVAAGFADADYSTYVRLTGRDEMSKSSITTTSWRSGHLWSDGLEPSSGKNYYVPSGARLVHPHSATADDNIWKGGQLVLGGVFHVYADSGDKNTVLVRDMVLLGGCDLRAACWGPFYPQDGVTSVVTVAGTAANPAMMSHHYPNSDKSRGNVCYADFRGTEDSVLVYTRPIRNYNEVLLENGYTQYSYFPGSAFENYPGTLILRTKNTNMRPLSGSAYNWPLTKIRVDEDAQLYMYYSTPRDQDVHLKSLDVSGGRMYMNYDSSGYRLYPVINLTGGFSVADGGVVILPTACNAGFKGLSPEHNDRKMWHLAHLTGTAAANVTDLSEAQVAYGTRDRPALGLRLSVYDGADGAKDVYVGTAEDIVCMTNTNIETSGSAGTAYGAFEAGHAGDWTNLETPASGSTLHYWAKKKLCFFASYSFPKATLTFGTTCTWKGGATQRFKTVNQLCGYSLGAWSSPTTRKFTAERWNIIADGAPASDNATLFFSGKVGMTLDADLYGTAGLLVRNNSDNEGWIALAHMNTNFHGRLTITQNPKDGVITPCNFNAILGDARNWGGEFTASANTYDAIKISNFPKVSVTNSVDFTEPTRGMLILAGATFAVNEGKTMRLSNQVTYAGVLNKTGAGTLDLAGVARFIDGDAATAPVADTNVINVVEGSLKVSSDAAADGLAVSFAEGTKLIVPANSARGYFNTKWNSPLTIGTNSGKLPVEIDVDADDEESSSMEVTLCTFNATAAENISKSDFAAGCSSPVFRVIGVEKRANGDDTFSFVATVVRTGARFIFR